ncbi:MAG TPA: HYR domain-containing protein [Bacteroidales bacterium]|nr:HYR domain-containing protein [Bacteroidales bacterium]
MVSDNCSSYDNLDIQYRVFNPDHDLTTWTTNNTPYNFEVGISQVEYRVIDEAGNVTTCIQQITVTDNQPPVVTVPTLSSSYNNTTGVCGYTVTDDSFDATATDNCGEITLTHNYGAWGNPYSLAGATFPIGTTIVEWTAVDAQGNITTETIIINVEDTEAPTFVNCPEGTTFTIGADLNCNTGVIWSIPVAQDNCGTVTVTETTIGGPLHGTQLAPGTYNIQYTATDAAGLTATCNFTVVITDDGAPLLVTQPDITLPADNGECTYTSSAGEFDPLLAVDNCPGYELKHTINGESPTEGNVPAGTEFQLGPNVITYTLTDNHGNSITQSFTVTIVDTQTPVLTCAADVIAITDLGECTYSAAPTIEDPVVLGGGGGTVPAPWNVGSVTDNCTDYDNLTIRYRVHGADNSISEWKDNREVYEFAIGVNQVEYEVVDATGNVTTCIQQVTVTDNQAPVVTVPTLSGSYNNTIGVCGYTVTDDSFDATATDNCGEVTLTHNYGAWGNPYSLAGATFPVGTTVVEWTAVDAQGNTTTESITIIVVDNEVPTFVNCPEGTTFTIGADLNCNTGVIWSIPVAEDNCGTVTVTETTIGGPLHGTQLAPGTYNIQYTATDAAGLTATCNFTVVITDDGAPLLVVQPDITLPADHGECTYTSIAGEFDPLLAVDNCPGYTLTHQINGDPVVTGNVPAGTEFQLGQNVITYTLTDNHGNSITQSFTVTIEDTQAPVLTCAADVIATTDANECDYTYTPNITATLVSDNCSSYDNLDIQYRVFNPDHDLTTWTTNNTPYNFEVGISQVEYRVIDEAGNVTTCIQQITVTDNQPPVVTVPTLSSSYNNTTGVCGYTVTDDSFDATATDNCGEITLTHNYGAWGNPYSLAGATFPVGTTIVEWTAVDAQGNTTTESITIVVVDNEAPTFVNCPEGTTFTIGADLNCNTGVIWSIPVAEDNCGTVTVTETTIGGPLHGTQLAPGTYNIQYTATDAAGLTATCNFTVVITDDGAPLLVVQPDITLPADNGECTYTSSAGEFDPLLAVDNCPGYTLTHQINGGPVVTGTVPAGTEFQLGQNVITYILTDSHGNEITQSFTVTIVDTQAPELTCATDVVATTDLGECTYTANPTIEDPVVLGGGGGTVPAPWNVGSVTDNCTDYDDLTIRYRVHGADNSISEWKDNREVYEFAIGISQVEYEVTDAAGNVITCIQQVTVTDNQAPVVTVPTLSGSYNNTTGVCGYTVTDDSFDATATDNCGEVTLTHNYGAWGNPYSLAGATFPVGTTIVEWTAVDAQGNTTTESITIVVVDNEAPTFVNCPEGTTFTISADINCATGVIWSIPVAEDNCGTVTVTETTVGGPLHGTQLAPGTYNIQYTATDAVGLTATCNFTVVIVDGAPLLVCQPDITVAADNNECHYSSSDGEFDPLLSVDNCPGYALYHQINTSSPDTGRVPATNFPIGVNTITYILTDISGDTVRCSFNLTVVDTQAPVLTCADDIVATTDPGECNFTYYPNISAALVSDNCTPYDNLNITYRVFNPDNNFTGWMINNTPYDFEVGISQVEYHVVDASGNVITCIQQVTVTDNQAPVVTVPTLNGSYNNTPGVCGYTVTDDSFDATATDNCGEVTLTHNYSAWGNSYSLAGATFPIGTTVVKWTAVDPQGNTTTDSITIVVVDTEAPTFVNCPEGTTFTIGADINCTTGVIWSIPIAEDNCGTVTVTETTVGGPLHGTQLAPGTYNIQYTATDGVGLTATCNFTVVITDDGAPLLVVQPDITLPADDDVCTYTSVAGEFDPLLAVDNCPGYTLTHQINGGPVVTGTVPAGTEFPLGQNVITYILTDSHGNEITQSFTVTIEDTQAPTIVCPAPLVLTPNSVGCLATHPLTLPDVADNCSSILSISYSVINSDNSFSGPYTATELLYSFQVGNSIVTWTVTDAAGNSAQCVQNIMVESDVVITAEVLTHNLCNAVPGVGSVKIITNQPGTVVLNGVSHSIVNAPFETIFTNLPSGYHTATFIAANSACAATTSFNIISQNSDLVASVSVPPILCNDSTTTATISVTGGTAPYQYILNGDTIVSNGVIENILPGIYNIEVIDANQCNYFLSFTVVEPTQMVAHFGCPSCVEDVDCYGEATGSATVTVTGGTTPYTYAWSHNPLLNNRTATGLAAGTYTVTITDANGCETTAEVTINEPATPLALTGAITDADCYGTHTGSIAVTITGGTQPYSYVWSNGMATPTISGLAAGNYFVTVTDANGCTIVGGAYHVDEPAEIEITVTSITHTYCNSNMGEAVITTTEAGTITVNGNDYTVTAPDFEVTVTGLTAGYYTATFTNSAGCTSQVSFNITNQNSTLSATVSVFDILCNGGTGSVTVTPVGGVAPYLYALNNGSAQSSSTFTDLTEGIYIVTVYDAAGCTFVLDFEITEPTPLTVGILQQTHETCYNARNGSATLITSGGVAPYTYQWPATAGNQTGQTAVNLAPGTYVVTVTDGNNCTTLQTVTILAAPMTIPNAGNDRVICETAGFIQIQGASATNYESVYWTTNGTGSFSNLFAMNPIYYPSAADIAGGTVILTLHAVPYAPCAESLDQMILQIVRQPQVTVDDGIICGGEQIEPVANAQYGTAYTWTSSGTGTFTDPNQINSAYIPSATDIANGFVNLTLTAQAASPCVTASEVGYYVIIHPITADAGTDQSLHGVSSTTLAANNPAPATGIWTLVSGPNNPVIANPTQYNTTISGLIEGEYVLQWTISNDPCAPSSDLMTIVVANSADLMIQKSTSNSNPVAGSIINYTITVTNLGSSAAQDVVVTDPLPEGLLLNNVVVTRGSWTTPLWTIGTLNVGQTASMSMTVTVDPAVTDGTQIYNVATVTSPTPDPNPNNNVDSVPIVVATQADLAIVKTTLQNTVIAGEEITYQLTVTNHGPSDALNTVVNDVLPNGLTLISATPSVGTWSQPNWSLGTLPVGGTETLTIVAVTSPALQPGTITNYTSVTSTTPDPVLSNNSSSVTNNIIVLADVEVIKVGSKNTVFAGDTMTYYITVTNHGPSTASNVVMTDQLPAHLTLISQTVSTGTWTQPNWFIGNMLPGTSETMTLVVRVNSNVNHGSIIVNNASVTSPTPDPDLTNNHSTYNVVVETITDLQVVKTADQTQVSAGEVITYTIDVYNHGPSYAHNVVMKDILPPNTTVQNVVTSTGSWLSPQWYIGTMADGAHETMTITLLVNPNHPDNSIIHNVATVESTTPETDLSNNISDVDVAVINVADLELTKISLEELVYPGDIVTYVISVTNHGPADAVNVVITDNYPAELTVISAQPSAGTWTMPDTWTINRIASGETVTMMIQMKLSDDVDGNVTISNYAIVTSDTPDPNLANNDDTADILTAYADLAITKVANATNVIVNELVEYKITATNLGIADAINVVITDQLPDGLELVHATGDPEVNGSLLTWRLARLDVGETYEITLVARVVRDAIVGEVIVNTVTITSETEDIDLSNNSDSAEILVDPLLVPFIPQGFSPNGDRYNDYFVIDGLERYPNNKLTIFNRWGNIVFEGAPYTNNFDGTTNRGLRVGGDELPSGTYFYILDLGVKDIEPIRGYIYIAR